MNNDVMLPIEEQLTNSLLRHSAIDVALLYGSAARGDVEAHSDIDLLLIVNKGGKRSLLDAVLACREHYPSKLSITIYTRTEFQFLARVQSLFLLHLSRESIPLVDRSCGFLTKVLRGFQPKNSYREDLEKSLTLLDPLRTKIENAPNQFHRLSQIYALFRVFGVYLLADKKIYEFSKEKMSLQLAELYPQFALSIRELSTLRQLNNLFFSSRRDRSPLSYLNGHLDLDPYLHALFEVSGQRFGLEVKSFPEAVNDFEAARKPNSPALDYRLRTWFLLLVYDGLNLFCRSRGLSLLVGFNEDDLARLSSITLPLSVRSAAHEVLAYMRSYPLKYFLASETKIRSAKAIQVLSDLAKDIS